MNILNKTLIITVGTSILASCGTSSKKDVTEIKPSQKYTIQTSYLDTATAPKDDFFQFANGTWIANNPVPESESRWGSFNELDKRNKEKLTQILINSSKALDTAKQGSNQQIIGDYFSAMQNMEARRNSDEEIIKKIKKEVAKVKSIEDIPEAVYIMKQKGINAFANLYVGQDLKDVNKNVLYISQGGLGLPNRDYYFDREKEKIRASYIEYMKHCFQILEFEDADQHANFSFKLESMLAKKMMKPAELRIPENTYNPTDINEVDKNTNFINISTFTDEFNSGEKLNEIIVGQPEQLKSVSEIIKNTRLDMIKSYIAWKYINHYAPHMGDKMVEVNFHFYGTMLSGINKMKPMNERIIEQMTGNAVKTALAQEFVALHFSEESKEKVNTMVDNLLNVYENRLQNLEWMTEETKEEALKKLHAIGRKLGYPDKWKDISQLKIVNDDHIANIDACNTFAYQDNMSKLGKPVDKDEWGMPAHMVNAYYHPLLNEIAFPAGIMQAPFFNINAEDAVNYGTIGMVIGHEFTHGFDDMGSKFAADGSFTNWWSEEDRTNFEERTGRLGKTFSGFCPIDGHCVNPELTMGENIADLGGITMAYHAYKMTDEYKSGEKREGFTPAQRFFIAYAQLWKINYTEAELKKRLATDPHSPGKYRVNGPLMNSPEFFAAFNIKEGDPMRKNEKEISKIW